MKLFFQQTHVGAFTSKGLGIPKTVTSKTSFFEVRDFKQIVSHVSQKILAVWYSLVFDMGRIMNSIY